MPLKPCLLSCFLLFFLQCASTLPAQVTCSEISTDPADAGFVSGLPASVMPTLALTVEVEFDERYKDEKTDAWTAIEKQYVCAAARRFQAVWSSQEFHDRVTGIKWWVLEDGHNVTGDDLYGLLTQEKAVRMKLAIKGSGSGWAISYPDGWTKITHTHIDRPDRKDHDDRGTALLGDLADNLSHEYTHYKIAGMSKDGGVVDDPRYVSYGIGCLTENIAIPNNTCWFDPSRPDLWRRQWDFPKDATEVVH